MYVTTVILSGVGNCSAVKHHMHHASMAELKGWVEFNNMVLGTPELHTPYFRVEHVDGSPLLLEELGRLSEVANVKIWQKRIRDSGTGLKLPDSHPNDGKHHSATAKAIRSAS